MGIYVYTLKKASRNIVDNGKTVKANNFSYAYRLSSKYDRMISSINSHAERAFESYSGGYIITADVRDEHGKCPSLNHRPVYKNLRSDSWTDTGEFPAEYVGYLVKKGRQYVLNHGVSEYEDDRAHVKAEHRIEYDYDHREFFVYYFTNKQTGVVTKEYIGKDLKEVEYVKKSATNHAHAIFDIVI